jgi:hypothetical protein
MLVVSKYLVMAKTAFAGSPDRRTVSDGRNIGRHEFL